MSLNSISHDKDYDLLPSPLKNYIVKIDTYSVRRAIRNILWEIFDIKIPVSAIKIKENSHLFINNYPILRLDKHYHFSNIHDRDYAIFRYLQNIELFIKNHVGPHILKRELK